MKNELPDMDYCQSRGWVIPPPPVAPFGFTKTGRIRKAAIRGDKELHRDRRARLRAAGLTARGTPRINRRSK